MTFAFTSTRAESTLFFYSFSFISKQITVHEAPYPHTHSRIETRHT